MTPIDAPNPTQDVMRSTVTEAPTTRRQPTIKVLPVNFSSQGGTNRKYVAQEASPGQIRHPAPQLRSYTPSARDIYFLGITIVIGGQYFGWTPGLNAGTGTFLVAFFVISLAYVAFCLCMAEITGVLPFAGGSYGLARCTLGFYPAFLIGCFEALEYMAAVATIMNSLSDMLIDVFPSLTGGEPLVWFVFYLLTLILQIRGEKWFWTGNMVLAVLSGGILLVYCVGCLPDASFRTQVLQKETQLFIGGAKGFVDALPYTAWFYLGIEALNLASDEVSRPVTQVPKAQTSCIASLVVTGLATLLLTISIPKDGGISAIATSVSPLNNGFVASLNTTTSVATLLSIPATYATAFGFLWCSTKLVHAMAASRLLPWRLASVTRRFNTPYVAAIVSAMISYAVCVLVYLNPMIKQHIFPLCLLFAFLSYSGQCIGYISLRRRYPPIRQSAFKNPLGIVAAVYALFVWLVGIVSLVAFHDHDELYFVATLTALLTVYYFGWARHQQVISTEENKILLKTHIWRNNGLRQQRNRRGSRTMPSRRATIVSALSQLFTVNKRTASTSSSQSPSARTKASKAQTSTTGRRHGEDELA